MGQTESETEACGRSQAHGVLQIEKIGAMAKRLKLGGKRAHDGDDQTFFKIGVNGAKAIDAQHHSPHIKSRVRSNATGWRLLSARGWACALRFATEPERCRQESG